MRAIDVFSRVLDVLAVAAVCALLCPEGAAELFSALIFHEAAHIAALRVCGARLVSLSPSGIGLRIRYAGASLSPRARLAIALSGAAANLALAIASAALGAFFFAAVNLVLAIFNLLPIEGLDGGEALSVILSDGAGYRAHILRSVSTASAAALWMFSIFIQLRVAPSPETLAVSSVMLVRELLS